MRAEQSDGGLSRLVLLQRSLIKRSKWFTKDSQNVQNGSKHDFSLNASKTYRNGLATGVFNDQNGSPLFGHFMDLFQNRFPASGFLILDFKRLVSSCGFSRWIFIKERKKSHSFIKQKIFVFLNLLVSLRDLSKVLQRT